MPRTKAMVVEISRSPVPLVSCSSAESSGVASASDYMRRCGRKPPSALRRSSMYCTSGESFPGW